MTTLKWRSLGLAALLCFTSHSAWAETIVKLDLGTRGPDVQLLDGILSTVDDGVPGSPGDQDSSVTFHGFVHGTAGVSDITPPSQGSFTLSDISMVGTPFVVDQGLFSLVTQQTTGGTFELYDDTGKIVLTGTLRDGSLHGTTGGSATGGFLTANLGSFTGPSGAGLDVLFSQLAPETASLAISMTDVSSITGAVGLAVSDDTLQNFTADATANVGADSINTLLPEPSAFVICFFAFIGLLGYRRRP